MIRLKEKLHPVLAFSDNSNDVAEEGKELVKLLDNKIESVNNYFDKRNIVTT